MANISDAYGTIEIIGEWSSRSLETLAYVLWTQTEEGDYSTYYGTENFSEFLTKIKEQQTIDYTAGGRWSFTNNLTNLWRWSHKSLDEWVKLMLKHAPDFSMSYVDYLRERDLLRQEIQLANLQHINDKSITYEIIEMDDGIIETSVGYFWADEKDVKYQPASVNQIPATFGNWFDYFVEPTGGYDETLHSYTHSILKCYNKKPETAIEADSWFKQIYNLLYERRHEWTIAVYELDYATRDELKENCPELVKALDIILL